MLKKIFKVLGIIVLVYLAIVVVSAVVFTVLHKTYFKNKYEQIEPYGEMVTVFDGQMHISKMGEGETTIVLLPGLGEGLPSADFAPLMRELSKDYTVVCVDYFGVGFSTQTARERTCENHVEEIREVLKNANIEGPYVLMPHSISSLYCEYYAACYPDEVKAIISLDGTPTTFVAEIPSVLKKIIPVIYKMQEISGAEISTMLTTNKKQWVNEYGYTEKEVEDYILYQGSAVNDNLIETTVSTDVLTEEVMALEYPKDVPYYKIIAKDTYEDTQLGISGAEVQMDHLERVGADDSYSILEGTHIIYRNHVKEISKITKEFLATIE